MARTKKLKEWRGKNDDAMPPASVRQRILEREKSTCHLCKGPITKPGWHADHVPPLKDGGENRESKMKPAHGPCHRKETARQAIERAPVERKKLKHTGAARPAGKIKSAPFQKSDKSKHERVGLPPRKLFAPGRIWPTGLNREE